MSSESETRKSAFTRRGLAAPRGFATKLDIRVQTAIVQASHSHFQQTGKIDHEGRPFINCYSPPKSTWDCRRRAIEDFRSSIVGVNLVTHDRSAERECFANAPIPRLRDPGPNGRASESNNETEHCKPGDCTGGRSRSVQQARNPRPTRIGQEKDPNDAQFHRSRREARSDSIELRRAETRMFAAERIVGNRSALPWFAR